ncbi:hypothetical protein [Ruminococcus flavefaciens]|uniref:hypothetical protein n=1 Tax=Ruminococcus flavefaciens TaxID=1265 RepID=UPI00048AAD94|nr:hypothetical protein [Ruminococcus flavefaciens]
MTIKEYLGKIKELKIDEIKVNHIEKQYSEGIPKNVKRLISNCDKTIFFDNDNILRLLSFSEIMNAEKDLHVDFKSRNMIPLFDCGDNDFIVYNYKDANWAKFNIIDEVIFKTENNLEEVF